jgi:hypothetical protein
MSYPWTTLPPADAGGVHERATTPSPAVATRSLGADGTAITVSLLAGEEEARCVASPEYAATMLWLPGAG